MVDAVQMQQARGNQGLRGQGGGRKQGEKLRLTWRCLPRQWHAVGNISSGEGQGTANRCGTAVAKTAKMSSARQGRAPKETAGDGSDSQTKFVETGWFNGKAWKRFCIAVR